VRDLCADDREVETPNKSIVKTRKKGKEKPKGGWGRVIGLGKVWRMEEHEARSSSIRNN
jgi:hypothetical protein